MYSSQGVGWRRCGGYLHSPPTPACTPGLGHDSQAGVSIKARRGRFPSRPACVSSLSAVAHCQVRYSGRRQRIVRGPPQVKVNVAVLEGGRPTPLPSPGANMQERKQEESHGYVTASAIQVPCQRGHL